MEMIITPQVQQPAKPQKNSFEKSCWIHNKLVVGIDEVGRGCLAGPLVTAAVALLPQCHHSLLKDSKLLTIKERTTAYSWIIKHSWFQVGIVHHRLIDQQNIWQATGIAMKKALINLLMQLPSQPGAILVDAMPLQLHDTGFCDIPTHSFPHGEQWSSSIAAASIVAKVARDALMEKYEILFPGYGFGQHKGYATSIHYEHIHALGRSMIHRESFLGAHNKEAHDELQQQLF